MGGRLSRLQCRASRARARRGVRRRSLLARLRRRGGAGGASPRLVYAPLERAPVPLSGRDGEPRPFRLLGQYKGALVLLEGPDGALPRRPARRPRADPVRALAARPRGAERPTYARRLSSRWSSSSRAASVAPRSSSPTGSSRPGSRSASSPGGRVGGHRDAGRALPGGGRGAAAHELAAAPRPRREPRARAASRRVRGLPRLQGGGEDARALAAEKLEALIGELFAGESPYACPHGRPIVLLLTDADLERRFGRR